MNNSQNKGRPPHQDILTPAEWKAVSLAQHGFTNQQIAGKLQVSINAVKYHISNAVPESRYRKSRLEHNPLARI